MQAEQVAAGDSSEIDGLARAMLGGGTFDFVHSPRDRFGRRIKGKVIPVRTMAGGSRAASKHRLGRPVAQWECSHDWHSRWPPTRRAFGGVGTVLLSHQIGDFLASMLIAIGVIRPILIDRSRMDAGRQNNAQLGEPLAKLKLRFNLQRTGSELTLTFGQTLIKSGHHGAVRGVWNAKAALICA